MAYEQKAGQGSLFKNEKKTEEKHPDYKGSLTTPEGVECWVSAWIKRQEGKATYMSLSIQVKDIQPAKVVEQSTPVIIQDDLPF